MNKGLGGCSGSQAVGTYKTNTFGLFDMLGNVWELTCSDATVESSARYNGSEKICTGKVGWIIRGGHWSYESNTVSSRYRGGYYPEYGSGYHLGFRLAQDL